MSEANDKDVTPAKRERRSHSKHAASFPFYWRDWLSAPEVRAMTRDQRGGYMDVICFTYGTSTPGVMTEDQVRAWAGYSPAEWPTHREVFAGCFRVRRDGMWVQERVARERAAQKKRFKSAAKAGEKGARKRWGNNELGSHPMQEGHGGNAALSLSLSSSFPKTEKHVVQGRDVSASATAPRDDGSAMASGSEAAIAAARVRELLARGSGSRQEAGT